jgi:carbonic anhydrase
LVILVRGHTVCGAVLTALVSVCLALSVAPDDAHERLDPIDGLAVPAATRRRC